MKPDYDKMSRYERIAYYLERARECERTAAKLSGTAVVHMLRCAIAWRRLAGQF